jgi:hypothetical protein
LAAPARADHIGAMPCSQALQSWGDWNGWILDRWGYLNLTFGAHAGFTLGPQGVVHVVDRIC